MGTTSYEAVVIGGSTGSMAVLKQIIPALFEELGAAVLVVYHIHRDSGDYMVKHLSQRSKISVRQPFDKELIAPGTVYICPPNYHLLVEWDRSISLSVDKPVNYSRPSIDVTFESAADVFEQRLVGIILSGANTDGSSGLRCIKERGGLTVVQCPESAEAEMMPKGALAATNVDYILKPHEIGAFINRIARTQTNGLVE